MLSTLGCTSYLRGTFVMNFINLPPFAEDGDVYVVVETPRGSRAKFAYDQKLETFILSKSLLTGLTNPHDWGFVPSTRADDGDPLDIMVIHDAATFPGIVLTCRIIGVLQIEQKSKGKAERNDRLFAVPRRSHSEQSLRDVRELSKLGDLSGPPSMTEGNRSTSVGGSARNVAKPPDRYIPARTGGELGPASAADPPRLRTGPALHP